MGNKIKACGIGCLATIATAIIIPVFLMFLLILVCIFACPDSGCDFENEFANAMRLNKSSNAGGVDANPKFDEIWSTGDADGEKFVRIAINGVIDLSRKTDTIFTDNSGTPAFALSSIKAATNDDSVRGIILEIDSPGGGVTDSDIIYNALRKFKEADTNRVVFVLAGDLCASGGYYISAAADNIMAHPTSVLGSIGVIMPGMNFKELADKIGVKEDSVSSGVNKTLGILGDMTDEQRALRQAIVDDMYSRFVSLVAEGRNMPEEKVREIADGSVFSATKCLELGLIDEIGYYDDLIEEIKDYTGYDSLHVVRYEAPISIGGIKGFGHVFGQEFGQALIKTVTEKNISKRQFLYNGK